jgi:Amt family ammonium transporter
MMRKIVAAALVVAAGSVAAASPAAAQELGDPASQVVLDNIFIFFAAVLVLLMQAGFALVEAGLTAAKNASNIMMKNMMDACVGILIFAAIGYGIAYPGDFNDWIGFKQFGVDGFMSTDPTGLIPSVDFLFQAAFAATAATIVSGAVAGRTQFKGYIVYSLIITGLIYPIVVSWQWGGGWMADMGFVDFAGSGLVHLTGGIAALAGAIVIGPRLGKFSDGKPQAIPGHSMPFAVVGVLLLFIGWFGFNPGSELAADLAVPVIAALTALAAAAGGVAATVTSWIVLKKPDVSMAGNGMLAGLVAICSGIGDMDHWGTVATGLVAGTIVVISVLVVERLGVDDPVGAFSVHGVCGFWGLVATGLFATTAGTNGSTEGLLAGGGAGLLGDQIVGGLAIVLFVGLTSLALFFVLKTLGILRVSPEDEAMGLDLAEHGVPGYGPEIPTPMPAGSFLPSAVPAPSN